MRGTKAAEWDKNTWGPLEDLAQNHPEAGVHFQGMRINSDAIQLKSANRSIECEIHNRGKDAGSATAKWFAELLSPNPWFKAVLPNVCRINFTDLLIRAKFSQVSLPSQKFSPSWGRLCHQIHLRVHQHRHLPPLVGFSVPEERRPVQTGCFRPHFRGQSARCSFCRESRSRGQLHWTYGE